MARRIQTSHSQHTFYTTTIQKVELPKHLSKDVENYTTFYKVQNGCENGMVFFYLGKGHKDAPNEIVAWYGNGEFWTGFGTSLQSAIEGAQRDAWTDAVRFNGEV